MRGGWNEPTHDVHRDLHAALVDVVGVDGELTMREFARYIMEATGVGTRMSVHRYADAMDLLGLIEWTKGEGVRVLAGPEPLPAFTDDGLEAEA